MGIGQEAMVHTSGGENEQHWKSGMRVETRDSRLVTWQSQTAAAAAST